MNPLAEQLGAFLFLLALNVFAYLFKVIREKYLERKSNKKENFVTQAKKDLFIEESLILMRQRYEADLICVYQLHNGSVYKSKDPIKYMSMTQYAHAPYTRHYFNESQSLRLYEFNRSFLEVTEKKVIYHTTEDSPDYSSRQKLTVRGFHSRIWAVIEDREGHPMGILAFYFIEQPQPITKELKKEIIEEAKKIGFKLNE